MHKCLVMFSGGLDSVVAAHLLKNQGLEVTALHFLLPFFSGINYPCDQVKEYANTLNIPILIEEEGVEFLNMIKTPAFGFGKNANPCLDCRIHRLKKAAKIMENNGFAFLATGEVIGQRPMSQRIDCLNRAEKISGLKGRLLRPLSAKKLPPTEAELSGIVDREKLLDISGRGRKTQLDYARHHRLKYATPAGGCLLTNQETATRYYELLQHNEDFSLPDFKLLAYGRHFRLSPTFKLVVSRNESENTILDHIRNNNHTFLVMKDVTGPVGLGIGTLNDKLLNQSASILARFSKARDKAEVNVEATIEKRSTLIRVRPAREEEICSLRIVSTHIRAS
ncbi:hypothetical protein QA601_02025 [Chitinispirillales bacterium ANBcel5]|uniref:hypothetical protein n=1 Tax=Cellulosispirillum alkaliphilum TaxID=3039283 RepID=UPI002A57BE9E|nr:hypothetical protein [Chitinispirillales bacterium ANBcel5]